jgi:hypothetical protein
VTALQTTVEELRQELAAARERDAAALPAGPGAPATPTERLALALRAELAEVSSQG